MSCTCMNIGKANSPSYVNDRLEPPRRWRTVLVEGQLLLRDLLAKALRNDSRFEVIAELDDPVQAEDACSSLDPDLLIADACLPQGDGLHLLEFVRKKHGRTRILVLSQLSNASTLQRLKELGVHGFVEKDQTLEILEEAMVEVASGRLYFTAYWNRNQTSPQTECHSPGETLSGREQEILRQLSIGQSSKAIAAQLRLSLRSVETYRYRIRQKLHVKSLAGLIKAGLSLNSPAASKPAGNAGCQEPENAMSAEACRTTTHPA